MGFKPSRSPQHQHCRPVTVTHRQAAVATGCATAFFHAHTRQSSRIFLLVMFGAWRATGSAWHHPTGQCNVPVAGGHAPVAGGRARRPAGPVHPARPSAAGSSTHIVRRKTGGARDQPLCAHPINAIDSSLALLLLEEQPNCALGPAMHVFLCALCGLVLYAASAAAWSRESVAGLRSIVNAKVQGPGQAADPEGDTGHF